MTERGPKIGQTLEHGLSSPKSAPRGARAWDFFGKGASSAHPLSPMGPPRVNLGVPSGTPLADFRDFFCSFWGPWAVLPRRGPPGWLFGSIWARFGVDLGSILARFGVDLERFPRASLHLPLRICPPPESTVRPNSVLWPPIAVSRHSCPALRL